MLICMSLKKSQKIQKCKFLLETCTNSRWRRHLQLGKVSTYFNEMLIFCDFLKPKRRFIFSFFPLFPPFPLFTFRAATISLSHPLKFCFFGFKKSPKISISLKKFETLPNCRWWCRLQFVQVSTTNLNLWIFGDFFSDIQLNMGTYGGNAVCFQT
jgi:hypothetical protein